MATQPREELVGGIASRDGHGVPVLQRHPLRFGVEGARRVLREGQDLLGGEPQLAADGSVDVLSELTTIEAGHPPVQQRHEAPVEQARGI